MGGLSALEVKPHEPRSMRFGNRAGDRAGRRRNRWGNRGRWGETAVVVGQTAALEAGTGTLRSLTAGDRDERIPGPRTTAKPWGPADGLADGASCFPGAPRRATGGLRLQGLEVPGMQLHPATNLVFSAEQDTAAILALVKSLPTLSVVILEAIDELWRRDAEGHHELCAELFRDYRRARTTDLESELAALGKKYGVQRSTPRPALAAPPPVTPRAPVAEPATEPAPAVPLGAGRSPGDGTHHVRLPPIAQAALAHASMEWGPSSDDDELDDDEESDGPDDDVEDVGATADTIRHSEVDERLLHSVLFGVEQDPMALFGYSPASVVDLPFPSRCEFLADFLAARMPEVVVEQCKEWWGRPGSCIRRDAMSRHIERLLTRARATDVDAYGAAMNCWQRDVIFVRSLDALPSRRRRLGTVKGPR